MPIPIVIAVLFLICYVIFLVIKKNRVPRPATAARPLNIKLWVTISIAIVAAAWFFTSSGIPVTQPMVRMKLEWVLPPGQLDRGINSDILDVVITKNEASDLWFETPYNKDGRMEVARYYLKKDGDKLSGSWSQNNPQDGGTLYLKKSGDQWIGQIVDRTERSSVINLRQY